MLQLPEPTVGSLQYATAQVVERRMPAVRAHRAIAEPAGGRAIVKRMLDIVIATAVLAAFAGPLLLAALAIRLDSPGPVLFHQRRIGRHGRSFQLWKLRTMYHHPPDSGRLCQARPHDPRITRIGAWLRRTSLDELPQLVQVLRGEMSMVGPRPHAPGTCAGGIPFEQLSERYALRHNMRPGITGLAQVRGLRGETDTPEKLLCRLDSDLEYIMTWSIRLDLVILARTVGSVLRMRNAY